MHLNFFFRENLAPNKVPTSQCEKVLEYIDAPLDRDYNCISFKNGILNTQNMQFFRHKDSLDAIPFLNIPFSWNENANGGVIEENSKSNYV